MMKKILRKIFQMMMMICKLLKKKAHLKFLLQNQLKIKEKKRNSIDYIIDDIKYNNAFKISNKKEIE